MEADDVLYRSLPETGEYPDGPLVLSNLAIAQHTTLATVMSADGRSLLLVNYTLIQAYTMWGAVDATWGKFCSKLGEAVAQLQDLGVALYDREDATMEIVRRTLHDVAWIVNSVRERHRTSEMKDLLKIAAQATDARHVSGDPVNPDLKYHVTVRKSGFTVYKTKYI